MSLHHFVVIFTPLKARENESILFLNRLNNLILLFSSFKQGPIIIFQSIDKNGKKIATIFIEKYSRILDKIMYDLIISRENKKMSIKHN